MTQAARMCEDLVTHHGDAGAFPAPAVLREVDLDVPGRKGEYLRAVAEAALEGRLGGATLRGAGTPDAAPSHENRLQAEVARLYGPGCHVAEVSQAWRPFCTWAAFHLRAAAEQGQV